MKWRAEESVRSARVRGAVALRIAVVLAALGCALAWTAGARAAGPVITVRGAEILRDGQPVTLLGLRTSNALMSEATTNELPGGDGSQRDPGVRWWLEYVENKYSGAASDPEKARRPGGNSRAEPAR